jgi:hypothetical protein
MKIFKKSFWKKQIRKIFNLQLTSEGEEAYIKYAALNLETLKNLFNEMGVIFPTKENKEKLRAAIIINEIAIAIHNTIKDFSTNE